MPTHTLSDLLVSRHRGASTGITLTLAAPCTTHYIGQIKVAADATQSTTVGSIKGGSETAPGHAELRAPQVAFDELLALASQPQSVKLTVSLTYDEASLSVSAIACRVAVAAAS